MLSSGIEMYQIYMDYFKFHTRRKTRLLNLCACVPKLVFQIRKFTKQAFSIFLRFESEINIDSCENELIKYVEQFAQAQYVVTTED